MKRLSILLLATGVFWLAACGWFERDEVGDQLQRGISGQGQLGPINRTSDDQATEHSVPQTHP